MSRKHSPGYRAVEEFLLKGKPVNETFLLEALYRYAVQVLKNPDAVKNELKGLDCESWIEAAADSIEIMDKHFKKKA
jgi:hypothetical protein